MEAPKQASWLVRKIFNAREWWSNDLQKIQGCAKKGKFNIHIAYVKSLPEWPPVRWKPISMIQGSLPKHQFTLWMAMHRRLATVDRLIKWGIQVDQRCVLCEKDSIENHEHLFFDCMYSKKLWESMLNWLGYHRTVQGWEEEISWLIKHVSNRNPVKAITGTIFAAVMYNIWMERNCRRFQQCKRTVLDIAKEIALQLHVIGQRKQKWKPVLGLLNNYPTCL